MCNIRRKLHADAAEPFEDEFCSPILFLPFLRSRGHEISRLSNTRVQADRRSVFRTESCFIYLYVSGIFCKFRSSVCFFFLNFPPDSRRGRQRKGTFARTRLTFVSGVSVTVGSRRGTIQSQNGKSQRRVCTFEFWIALRFYSYRIFHFHASRKSSTNTIDCTLLLLQRDESRDTKEREKEREKRNLSSSAAIDKDRGCFHCTLLLEEPGHFISLPRRNISDTRGFRVQRDGKRKKYFHGDGDWRASNEFHSQGTNPDGGNQRQRNFHPSLSPKPGSVRFNARSRKFRRFYRNIHEGCNFRGTMR